MWIFCILTAVVVAQIYKCDKNCRELNTQIGTHMSACKTDEIWISSVNYVNVSFLTVILYYYYTTVMLCCGGNWVKKPWNPVFCTTACESTVVSKRFKKWKMLREFPEAPIIKLFCLWTSLIKITPMKNLQIKKVDW